MKRKMVWLVVSCLMVLALLAASCAKAEEKAPAVKEVAPAVKEAAPAVKEAAPVVEKVTPTVETEAVPPVIKEVARLAQDSVVMSPVVKEPRYGGVVIMERPSAILDWDEGTQSPWFLAPTISETNEELLTGNWAMGLAGTGEELYACNARQAMPSTVGNLAESWELEDDTTIVFNIRKGVKWALNPNSAASRLVGGREFTADDAVFNIKRIYFDITTSIMFGMLGSARPTEVYARDKYTVVVKTPKGMQGMTFEALGDNTRMYAPEVIKKYGHSRDWENIVGTGPFLLTDYVPMSSVAWVRNPNYWQTDPVGPGKGNQLPYLDGLKTLIIPDFSTMVAALRTGKIDMPTTSLGREDAQSLMKSNPWLPYYKFLERGFGPFMAMRVDKPDLPFADIRVRRAIQMGINRQDVLNYLGGEGAIPIYKVPPIPEYLPAHIPVGQFAPSADGFDTNKLFSYNPDEAKKLLAEAGYPNGFKTQIIVPSSGWAGDPISLFSIYKADLAKISIDMALEPREYSVFVSIRFEKNYPEMICSGRSSDPYNMYLVRAGNMFNFSIVSEPKIDAYYDQCTALYFDEPARLKKMREINQYLIERADYFVGPRPFQYRFWQPWLRNYHGQMGVGVYNNFYHLRFAWLDQELKQAMGR